MKSVLSYNCCHHCIWQVTLLVLSLLFYVSTVPLVPNCIKTVLLCLHCYMATITPYLIYEWWRDYRWLQHHSSYILFFLNNQSNMRNIRFKEKCTFLWGKYAYRHDGCFLIASVMMSRFWSSHIPLSAIWPNVSVLPFFLIFSSQIFRMVTGCVGVSEDSTSRHLQSWRWRAPQSQHSWMWTRAWLWPALPSSACCWWPWSSAVQKSSWTPTAPFPPPHGRSSTWMTNTQTHKHTYAKHLRLPQGNHTWQISKVFTQRKRIFQGFRREAVSFKN